MGEYHTTRTRGIEDGRGASPRRGYRSRGAGYHTTQRWRCVVVWVVLVVRIVRVEGTDVLSVGMVGFWLSGLFRSMGWGLIFRGHLHPPPGGFPSPYDAGILKINETPRVTTVGPYRRTGTISNQRSTLPKHLSIEVVSCFFSLRQRSQHLDAVTDRPTRVVGHTDTCTQSDYTQQIRGIHRFERCA